MEIKTEFVLKVKKVPKLKHKKVGFRKTKIKAMTIRDIFTIQMSFANKKLSKTQSKIVEERNHVLKLDYVLKFNVRHIGRRRDAHSSRGA